MVKFLAQTLPQRSPLALVRVWVNQLLESVVAVAVTSLVFSTSCYYSGFGFYALLRRAELETLRYYSVTTHYLLSFGPPAG